MIKTNRKNGPPIVAKTPIASRETMKSKIALSRWLPVILLAIAAAIGWEKYDSQQVVSSLTRTSTDETYAATATNVESKLINKYQSDLVTIQVRHLVTSELCVDNVYSPIPLDGGEIVHVIEAMEVATPTSNDKVFFMLNGRNEGVYVSWNGDFDCIARAANVAAIWLGVDRDVLENGVRLYSQMGIPVRNAKELAESNSIVHLLLDFQLWQWPGIRKGYKYTLENGVTLTLVGESPKVFDVEYFFTQEEADKIIAIGVPTLNRSRVGGVNASTAVSAIRTSHTSFLKDDAFTRDLRARSAQITRLPSASYAERPQLVRYAAGEFYRQHHDTMRSRAFLSKNLQDFLPNDANQYTMKDYEAWVEWAAQKLRELDVKTIPEEFREDSGSLFPNAIDTTRFPNALLDLFFTSGNQSNLFMALNDPEWPKWIRSRIDQNSTNLMPVLMNETGKPNYLPLIIKAWERKLGRPELAYTFPKKQVNAVSHFFHWIRWVKERIAFLGDEVPATARPDGALYPKFDINFQMKLLNFILDDYSQAHLTRLTNTEWYQWMLTSRKASHTLFAVLKAFPSFAEVAIKTWEARVMAPSVLRYKLPKYIKHFQPQRYVTLFLYLNNQTIVGGETVFPYSLDRFKEEKIERHGMDECSSGLAIPPIGLHASLFYVQTPEGDVDLMSRHGGCPPEEGVKWGVNSFMWDSDADEGADLWTTK